MESQLRNSLIDKMTTLREQKMPKGLRKPVSPALQRLMATRQEMRDGREKSIASNNVSRRRISTQSGRVDNKDAAVESVKTGGWDDSSTISTDKQQDDDGFIFEKEE